MEKSNKGVELNNISLDEIKKAFRDKLGFRIEYYNDLNTDKTVRRIKIKSVSTLNFEQTEPGLSWRNLLYIPEKRDEIILFLEKELGIKGVEVNRSGWGSFPKLAFKIKNK